METAANAGLDAIGAMMNGGSIELLEASGNVVATLKLSNPAAQAAVNGELAFNEIRAGIAQVRGQPVTARILSRADEEVLVV